MFGQDGKKCTFAVFNCPFIDLWVARRIQFSKLETQTLHFLHTYLCSIYVDTRKNGECKTAFPHLVSCASTHQNVFLVLCILHKNICTYYIDNCLKIDGTTLFSSKSFPLISAGPQKPQKLTASKIKYEKFGPKILISQIKMDILVP